MTKTIETKFEKPNEENVEIGDFVVSNHRSKGLIIYPITGIGKKSVFYYEENYYLGADPLTEGEFGDLIILKKNGRYLIGRKIDLYKS